MIIKVEDIEMMVVDTRSVISLGLSTFRLLPGDEDGKAWSYAVTTYNITLLCQASQHLNIKDLLYTFISRRIT